MKLAKKNSTSCIAVASLAVTLILSTSPAHAHGSPLVFIPMLLGPLVVHLGAPAFLLFSKSFRGRRARVVGSYTLIMFIYYIAMLALESFPMYVFPAVPALLAGIFYVAAARIPEDD